MPAPEMTHLWPTRKETPAKRIRTPRHNTNVTKLGNVYAVSGDDEEAAVDEVVQEATASDKEKVAPESYKQAFLNPRWRESMMTEVRALRNRGCWRVVPTPSGVRLIKSKYVYKLTKDRNCDLLCGCRHSDISEDINVCQSYVVPSSSRVCIAS